MADMNARFDGLKKIPQVPARRLMAATNLELEADLSGPATAGVPEVLAELDAQGAVIDMIKLLAASLPAREAAWWSCLAGRDLIGPEATPSAALTAAEAWVFRPSEETRTAAFNASEAASPGDDTVLCASIAVYAGGSLGPGDLSEMPPPEGAIAAMAFGMNVLALDALGGDLVDTANHLVDRALDIARGGNGRVARSGGTAG